MHQSMKIVIIGGGGFLGAWLCRRLLRSGHRLTILDPSDDKRLPMAIAGAIDKVEWIRGDVRDGDTVDRALRGQEAVIHLAGLLTPACRENPVVGAQVNLIGALNVFQAALRHGLARVLYTSSAAVYGPHPGQPPHPTTLYGTYKLATEQAALSLWHSDGLESFGLRPYIVYGPGRERGVSADPTLACRAAARGECYRIGFQGDCDLIHVDDVASAFEQALEADIRGARVANLGTGRITVESFVERLMAQVPEADIRAGGDPLPFAFPESARDCRTLLPYWVPRSLDEGIAETVAYYR